MPPLKNSKHEMFLVNLRKDEGRNQANAYMAVTPKCKSIRSAATLASRWLKRVDVATRLRELDEMDMAKHHLTMDNINRIKADILFFDPLDLLDDKGVPKPLCEIPKATRMAMERIKVTVKTITRGDAEAQIVEHDIQWAKKAPILDQATRQLGGYEKDNDQVGGTMAELIRAVDGNTRGLPPPEDEE